MTSWADVTAQIQGIVHKPAYTLYSVCGTGVAWNVGYPFDLGDTLYQQGLIEHQPIGYRATAFPMQPSIDEGVAELRRQIALRDPSDPKAFVGYSQGAIITSIVYEQMRNEDDELHPHFASFLGGVTFGNPRRQEGHTIPGGVDPGGHGIVTPNMMNTPASWLDFAAGKGMVNSPGNDLYATCGAGETAEAVADQEAIWSIVDKGTISAGLGLVKQVASILPNPLVGGLGAIEAAMGALNFFVVKGITPHTSYQFVQPIAGDSRDCWRVALDYLTALAQHPAPLTQKVESLMTAPTATPAAEGIDLATIEKDLKEAVNGLLKGLSFVQKFEALVPEKYRGTIDTAVKVLTVVDGVL